MTATHANINKKKELFDATFHNFFFHHLLCLVLVRRRKMMICISILVPQCVDDCSTSIYCAKVIATN